MHPAQQGVAHLRLGGSIPVPMAPILFPERSRILPSTDTTLVSQRPRRRSWAMHQAQEPREGLTSGSEVAHQFQCLLWRCHLDRATYHTSTHQQQPRQSAGSMFYSLSRWCVVKIFSAQYSDKATSGAPSLVLACTQHRKAVGAHLRLRGSTPAPITAILLPFRYRYL